MHISWNHRAAQGLALLSILCSTQTAVTAQGHIAQNNQRQWFSGPQNAGNANPLPEGYPQNAGGLNSEPGYATPVEPVPGSDGFPSNAGASTPLPEGYPGSSGSSSPLPNVYPSGSSGELNQQPGAFPGRADNVEAGRPEYSGAQSYGSASGQARFSSPFQSAPQESAESSGYNNYQQNFCRPQPGWLYPQQRYGTLPSGITLPISLDTTIAPETAKKGDYIQAHITQNITLGGPNYLPGGTVVTGEVVPPDFGQSNDSKRADRKAERKGSMTILFDQFRLPNGLLIPLQAHLVGDIDNYKPKGNEANKPEGFGAKLLNFGLRTTLGNGMGSAFGAGLGGISQGHYGVGSGAYYGMAMGSASGAMYGALQRHPRGVLIHAGTQMQMQIEQPVQIPAPTHGNRQQGAY